MLSQFSSNIGTFSFLCCKQLAHHIRTEVASWAALEANLIQTLTWQLKWRYTRRRRITSFGRRGCRDATNHTCSSTRKWCQWNLRLRGRGWWRFKVMLRWRRQRQSISGNRRMWMRRKSCKGLTNRPVRGWRARQTMSHTWWLIGKGKWWAQRREWCKLERPWKWGRGLAGQLWSS